MNMKAADKRRLIKLYEDRCNQYGYDVRAVGWGDTESQLLRFRILSEIGDLSGCNVCDMGCGFGDLYPYLNCRYESVRYHGVDLCGDLIREACKRYPTASFEVRDLLEDPVERAFDYVLSSGALSFKTDNHELYVQEMLSMMMGMARKGVAINFLSSYVDYQLDKNFHYAPERAMAAGKELTRYVTIRHDYPLHEFTLYMYKEHCA